MTIVPAKAVGEMSPGFITFVLWPDKITTKDDNDTSTEMADNIAKDLVPEDLRKHGTNVWVATEKNKTGSKGYAQRIFPRNSEEYPDEYYDWLKEIEAK
jgi:hypothetical protein